MRFLGLNLLMTMTPGYFLVILQAKLESQNLMFRLAKKRRRQRNLKRIRRKAIAKNLKKSNNKMKNINANLKRKRVPRFTKLNSFGSTRKIITTSKTWKISRRLKNSRGQPKEIAGRFKVSRNKLSLMKPKDNLTKPCSTRWTQSTKTLITH